MITATLGELPDDVAEKLMRSGIYVLMSRDQFRRIFPLPVMHTMAVVYEAAE